MARVPPPSQPAGSSQAQRSDVPKTPHKSRAAVPQGLSQRPAAPPLRPSTKGPPPLPGFVNAFVVPPQKKGKEKAHAPAFGESQRTREQNVDLSQLSTISIPVNISTHTQADEGMEIDGSAVSGQADSIIYPDVDFHMDLPDDVKMPQPIPDVSRSSKPFDWVNWVSLQLPCLTLWASHSIDETNGTRSRNVATCPEYDSTSACSATTWYRSHRHVPFGLHVPYKCGGRLDRVRARCASRRKFTSTNHEYNVTRYPGQLSFSFYFQY